MKAKIKRNALTALLVLSVPVSSAFAQTAEANARPPRYEDPPSGGSNDEERQRQQDADRERERQALQEQQQRERQREEQDRRDAEERDRQRQEQERREIEERDRWEREHQSGGYAPTPHPIYTPDPGPIYSPDPEPIYMPEPNYGSGPQQPDPVIVPPPPKEYIFGCQQNVGFGCRLLEFWWQKPHYIAEVKYSDSVSTSNVNTLTLESVMNQGLTGQRGTLGVTSIDLFLDNGQKVEMMTEARRQFPDHVARNGQIFMKADGDKIAIRFPQLPAGFIIKRVRVKADSWIAPGRSARLQLWFDSQTDPIQTMNVVTP